MAFKAKYQTLCPHCNLNIYPGDSISWARTGENKGKTYHAACYALMTGKPIEETDADNTPKPWDTPIPTPSPTPTPTPTPVDIDVPEVTPDAPYTPKPAPVQPNSDNPITKALLDALWPTIEAHVTSSVDMAQVEAFIDAKLKDFQAPTPKSITFNAPNVPPITVDTPHPLLHDMIQLLLAGLYPYAWNGAGAGKTHAALDAAKILGYTDDNTYVMTCNPFSSPIELSGYTDALGKLVEKAFIKAFRDGGFMILDEADRARPDFLPALNSALAQKAMLLPDGTMITMHENFRLVLTGNTPMHGASKAYNSAQPQDASVKDRIFHLYWTYDEQLERNVARGLAGDKGEVWCVWLQNVRHYVNADKTKADLLVTLRAVINGIKLFGTSLSLDQIADGVLFKGCAPDTKTRILEAHPLPKGIK